VQRYSPATVGVIIALAGLMQVAAGLLRLGRWFRAVSPAVISGMLAGIGVLIFASQFHVMVDDKPKGSGLKNLASVPEAVYKGVAGWQQSPPPEPDDAAAPVDPYVPPGTLTSGDETLHHKAAVIGLLTIGVIVAWKSLLPRKLVQVVP